VIPDEIDEGHLKAMLVTGGNPLTAFPQPERLGRAFDQLEVVAVWDIVHTATADHATHLFPCPDPLERPDFIAPIQLSKVFAHYTPRAVPALADRRPMWWSLAKLAQRMGLSILPGDADPDSFCEDDLFRAMVNGTPVSWETLRDAGGHPVEFPQHDRWVEETVLPDGRWDVAPGLLVDRFDHAMSRPWHQLVLGNRREMSHTNSTLAWGVTGVQSLLPFIYLNRNDAISRGVVDGQPVEVRTEHGAVVGAARIDDSLAPGTVVIPHGFSEPNVGHLTAVDVDVDPLTGMPTLVGVPVTVAPAAGSA
jgi:anaerobic selenocysteine-containing dehydrogenase